MIVKINDRQFDFFNFVDINLKYDTIASTFGFKAVFDQNNQDHKDLFKPLAYSKLEIIHNGETLIVGTKINSSHKSSSLPSIATISGYSLTGVLEDSSIPIELYPLQSDGLSLKEIAEKLLKPFNISLVIDPAVAERADSVYSTTEASVGETVKDYLTKLATQKSIILTHTSGGALLLTEAKADQQPIADLSDAFEKELAINGQPLHDSITMVKEANIDGGNSGEEEITNSMVNSFRPKISVQSSGDDVDTVLAAKRVRAAEIGSIKLTIKLDTWIVNDRVIKPNQVISITDPELYLYKKSNWFIESVQLTGDEKAQVATLHCVLPSVYTNQDPVSPF